MSDYNLFDLSDDSQLTCYYCGLHHKHVEAGGVWHCPNPLCTGPGAAHFRSKLKSYEELEGGKHTVDQGELLQAGLALLATIGPNDTTLVQAIVTSAAKMIEKSKAREAAS